MAENNEFKKKFDDKVLQMLNEHHSDRAIVITKERYEEIIREVKESKLLKENKQPLTSKQYRRLKRYDIKAFGQIEKLIENKSKDTTRYYCHNQEMFDILHDVHVNSGHKSTKVMETEIKKRYCNVTREIINIYLSVCEKCQQKKQGSKRGFILKPMIMNSCCYVDIIDMQTEPDGQYHFILFHQDHLTKFILLRPLKTRTPNDVANELMDIFCIFGTPCILRSDGVKEFAQSVIEHLSQMRRGVKLVYGSSRQSQNRCHQELKGMLLHWMLEEKSCHWSEGLRFVQNSKNRCYNDSIRGTPYEAMFGNMQRVGLEDSTLPLQVYYRLKTEEDLEKAIDDWNDKTLAREGSSSEGCSNSKRKKSTMRK